MKQFKSSFPVLAILIFAIACKENQSKNSTIENKSEKINIEKLSASFDSSWNSKDSAGVVNLLADDAVLISGRYHVIGKDSLIKNFVMQKLPITSQLKVSFLQTGVSEDIAYESGSWTMKVSLPGKTPFDQSGNYTFIWKKQSDGKWKTSMLEIEDYLPEN